MRSKYLVLWVDDTSQRDREPATKSGRAIPADVQSEKQSENEEDWLKKFGFFWFDDTLEGIASPRRSRGDKDSDYYLRHLKQQRKEVLQFDYRFQRSTVSLARIYPGTNSG